MYAASAEWYDLLYEKGLGKDYAAEADQIASLLPQSTRSVLDVACGTGRHLEHLATRFECAGLDLSPEMVAIAAARCPDGSVSVGDMTSFDLGRTFDAVVCLFSSIGYVRTADRLHAAIGSMARHVAPNGVLLVEPWLTPDVWTVGHLNVLNVDEPDLKVCRMMVSGRDGSCSVMDAHYLVATADGIQHLTETHTMGLFTWDEYREAFEATGLDTTIDQTGGPMGRGLIVGRRPS